MIAVVYEGGVFAPRVVCDACGEEVHKGNAYWLVQHGDWSKVLEGGRVWHTHKWPCSGLDKVLEARYGGRCMSEEVGVWLEYVRRNLKHSVAKL